MKNEVYLFGGKKLARARTTVYAGQHETWLKAYQSARNRTMMIQGRRQGKFSNNLFQYHIEEGVLIYRCSSEKREIPLKIEFHQYKEELERAVRLPHNTPGKAVAYVLEDHGAYFIIKAIRGDGRKSEERRHRTRGHWHRHQCQSYRGK